MKYAANIGLCIFISTYINVYLYNKEIKISKKKGLVMDSMIDDADFFLLFAESQCQQEV